MNGPEALQAPAPATTAATAISAGVVVWAWLALVDSRKALGALDALDGMHFDR